MRDIKFRGVDIKTGEMVFGGGIDSQRDTPIIINHGERYFVDAKTVGQYTGEKDIDDKELYISIASDPAHTKTRSNLSKSKLSHIAHGANLAKKDQQVNNLKNVADISVGHIN